MVEQRRAVLWQQVLARAQRSEGWAVAVCAVACRQAGVDGAAISLRADGRGQELVASSGAIAVELEEVQYTVGEGPAVEASRSGGPVLVSDVAAEDGRWPGFTLMAGDAGVGAVFALPLRVGAIRLGCLGLYRLQPGRLSASELRDSTVLADLAAAAVLSNAGQDIVVDIPPFTGHYDEVNLATGMLAAQLGVSVQDASARLRSHAFSNGLSPAEVARDIVNRRLRLDPSRD